MRRRAEAKEQMRREAYIAARRAEAAAAHDAAT
jgi:hypothetical protein